jgi:hypothetical protein
MPTNISLVNGRVHGWLGTQYIGRQMIGYWACTGSPLANRFKAAVHTETEHSCVVALYRDWLLRKIEVKDKAVCQELQRLLDMYSNYEQVVLSCWCKPLPCHGDVVLDVIQSAWEANAWFW